MPASASATRRCRPPSEWASQQCGLRHLVSLQTFIDIGINNPVGLGVPVLGLLGLVLVGLESASEWMLQPWPLTLRGLLGVLTMAIGEG